MQDVKLEARTSGPDADRRTVRVGTWSGLHADAFHPALDFNVFIATKVAFLQAVPQTSGEHVGADEAVAMRRYCIR